MISITVDLREATAGDRAAYFASKTRQVLLYAACQQPISPGPGKEISMLDVCGECCNQVLEPPFAGLLVLEGLIAALVWLPLRTLGVVPQDLGLDAIGLVAIALLVGWAAEITRTDPRKE